MLAADVKAPDPDAAASRRAEQPPLHTQWEMRAVNGRGLDLRLRIPEGLDGLEAGLRARVGACVKRGNVTLSLRLTVADDGRAMPRVDPVALAGALQAVAAVQSAAEEAGVALRPPTAAEVLHLRGVLPNGAEPPRSPEETAGLVAALLVQAETLIAAVDARRADEGSALAVVLDERIDSIAALIEAARALIPERRAAQEATLRAALERLETLPSGADPGRLEAELALIATRADVAEELDRLTAHITAARKLLAGAGPVGRQLEFLIQEFNREANTLCSKAQHAGLTGIGLDLKAVIDQMREQSLNLE